MATRGARCRPRRDNPARTPGRHPLPLLPRAAPQVTLRPLRSRSEETVVTEDPGRATLIDKEECSMSEDIDLPDPWARRTRRCPVTDKSARQCALDLRGPF